MQRAWDQVPGESTEQFEAFQLYLKCDHVVDVTRALCKRVEPWAAAFQWRARKAAYVRALAVESEDAARAQARTLGIEHAEALSFVREQALSVLRDAFARGEVGAKEALKALAFAIEGERLADGLATSRVGLDLSGRSDAELDALERALKGEALAAEPEPAPN